MVKTGNSVSNGLEFSGQSLLNLQMSKLNLGVIYNFTGTSTVDESTVSGEVSEGVDTVLNSSFDVIEEVGSTSSQNNSSKSALVLIISFKNSNSLTSDFFNTNAASFSDLFSSRGTKSDQSSSAKSLADSSKFELRGESDGHEFVSLEEMKNDLRNSTTDNNNLATGISNTFNEFMSVVFFTLVIVKKFLSVFNKNGALSIGSLGFKGATVDNNLSISGFGNTSFSSTTNNKTTYNEGVAQTTTKNLGGSNIFEVEVFSVLGKDTNTCFSDL